MMFNLQCLQLSCLPTGSQEVENLHQLDQKSEFGNGGDFFEGRRSIRYVFCYDYSRDPMCAGPRRGAGDR